MNVTFVVTGGTIDKDYASGVGAYDFMIGQEPAISRICEKLKLNINFDIKQVLTKDSLEMDDNDREEIFNVCYNLKNDKIIITHGTDTMVETAKTLSKIEDKLIVLVGASRPEVFKDTDADFNIGCAIGASNCLSSGVYIVMSGKVYKWDQCKKEENTGKFIEN